MSHYSDHYEYDEKREERMLRIELKNDIEKLRLPDLRFVKKLIQNLKTIRSFYELMKKGL